MTRINSYTTAPTTWSAERVALAKTMNVVTFASPSAVKNWAANVGTEAAAVTIGPTTAQAARSEGFKLVYSPPQGSKGVEIWAVLIREVARKVSN